MPSRPSSAIVQFEGNIRVPIHLYLPAAPQPEAVKAEAKTSEAVHLLDNWREPPGMLGVYVRRVKKQASHLAANSQRNTK